MLSFRFAFFLFVFGLINLGLGFFGGLPYIWMLICVGVGLGSWFLSAILSLIDRAFRAIHHLKRFRQIQNEYKADKAEEEKQVIQRGSSEAMKSVRKNA